MAKLKVHLVIIDGQNDFCDLPGAALPVTGADADMKRISTMIRRIGHRLEDIHCTMDSHRLIDIAHPAFWMDQNGKQPPPFTFITDKDIEGGIWMPRNPAFRKRTLDYTKALEATGKYVLCIWPAHCLIGTWGQNMHDELNKALQEWSSKEFAMVDYVTKGSNPWTEHYGALMAEVPDPSDPGTALNTNFLTMLSQADVIGVCGEASSHCVKKHGGPDRREYRRPASRKVPLDDGRNVASAGHSKRCRLPGDRQSFPCRNEKQVRHDSHHHDGVPRLRASLKGKRTCRE